MELRFKIIGKPQYLQNVVKSAKNINYINFTISYKSVGDENRTVENGLSYKIIKSIYFWRKINYLEN